MRKLLLASIMLVWGSIAFAQEKTVSGKVTSSEDGSPLPGVSVLIKGSTKGVTTDGNGVYKISAATNATLNFSFIGFTTQSVQVGGRAIVDVQLKADAAAFNEVVVTAQGIRKNIIEIVYAYSKEDNCLHLCKLAKFYHSFCKGRVRTREV
jgi:hypothetical protein